MYGIPWFGTSNVIYYNNDLFEQAGIDECLTTWAEFQAASEKIYALGADMYGYSLKNRR